jgi:hypothetical protein
MMLQGTQVSAHLDKWTTPVKESLLGKTGRWRYDKAFLPFYEIPKNEIYSRANLELFKSYLDAMNQLCLDGGASFIVYYVPSAVEVSSPLEIDYFPWDHDIYDRSRFDLNLPYNALAQIAGPMNITVVNLRQPLAENSNQPVYFRDSWHWNQEGHRTVAAFIAQDIERRNLLSRSKEK